MKLYLGGKMIGVPEFGAKIFNEAADTLRSMGHTVFNPVDHDTDVGFDPAGTAGTWQDMTDQGFDRRKALAFDMAWIAEHSEGMVALDNWMWSPGAKAEVAFHHALFLPVWLYSDFVRSGNCAPQVQPWQPSVVTFMYPNERVTR